MSNMKHNVSNFPTLCTITRFVKDDSAFDHFTLADDAVEGIIVLRAPVNSAAAHEFTVSTHVTCCIAAINFFAE